MKFRACLVLMVCQLLFGAAAAPAGGNPLMVAVTIPSQPRAITVPISVTLPAQLAMKPGNKMGWRAMDGSTALPTQPEDKSGRTLRIMLPLTASKTAAKKTLTLELVPLPAKELFQIEDIEKKSLQLSEGKTPVLTYNYGMMLKTGVVENRARSCYVHPLFSPDGTLITDDFPADHLHHRGMSWMWPRIGVGGGTYSTWDIRGIKQQFERWLEKETGAAFARIGVENGWYVGEKKVVKERVSLVVCKATAEGRAIDITLVFEATDQPVTLSGTTDQQKGYGGFSLRFAPRKEKETVITTSGGKQEKDTDRVPFPWADLSARFTGEGRISGAAIFVDAGHPGFPNGWTLREYGFLGVAWPGLDTSTLEPGRPITLRYRVWLHPGDASQGAVAEQYAVYAKPLATVALVQ